MTVPNKKLPPVNQESASTVSIMKIQNQTFPCKTWPESKFSRLYLKKLYFQTLPDKIQPKKNKMIQTWKLELQKPKDFHNCHTSAGTTPQNFGEISLLILWQQIC